MKQPAAPSVFGREGRSFAEQNTNIASLDLLNSLVNGVAVSAQVKAQSMGTLFRC